MMYLAWLTPEKTGRWQWLGRALVLVFAGAYIAILCYFIYGIIS
jgi:hypothetical protein